MDLLEKLEQAQNKANEIKMAINEYRNQINNLDLKKETVIKLNYYISTARTNISFATDLIDLLHVELKDN